MANYYLACAKGGKGATLNLNVVAVHLGLPLSQVREAHGYLVKTKRVKMVFNKPHSIDGIAFGGLPQQDPVVSFITDNLRKRFSPVYDPRRVANPETVPTGPPKQIVVGNNTMDTAYAYALATILASPVSGMRAA